MYEDGFTSIANIDISKVVVEQMKERHKDKATLTCKYSHFPPLAILVVWARLERCAS